MARGIEQSYEVNDDDTEDLLFVKKRGFNNHGSYGGWKRGLLAEHISASEQKLLVCTFCNGLMRNACVVFINNNREPRCEACIPKKLKNKGHTEAELVRSVIDERRIYCPLKGENCKWIGPTIAIYYHLRKCEHIHVPCPLKCLENNEPQFIQRKSLRDHMVFSCPKRLVPCDFCQLDIEATDSNSHLSICDYFPVQCPNRCNFQSPKNRVFLTIRKQLQEHLDLECPLQQIQCPYSEYGCKVVGTRKHFETHKINFMEEHLNLVEACLRATSAFENDIEHASLSKLSLKSKKNYFDNSFAGIEWRILNFGHKMKSNNDFNSHPFYSSGYKLRFNVEFNIKNHIGVFLQVIKGEYDDELSWPFRSYVQIILVNVNDESYNHIHSFSTYNLQGKSVNKPKTNQHNAQFGVSQFISHVDIMSLSFCINDSILLRFLTQTT